MDLSHFETAIEHRLEELGIRIHGIDISLGQVQVQNPNKLPAKPEDDEAPGSIRIPAQKEILLLKSAWNRIRNETYGVCVSCGELISEERLDAELYTPSCHICAATASA